MTNIDDTVKCFILVENGQPVNHPVMGENLTMFFPDFDPENPPEPFEKFLRIPLPHFNQMQKYVGTTYEKINGIWQDVHHIEQLTPEEKTAKISEWESRNPMPYENWKIEEESLRWVPAIPCPDDGNEYIWDFGVNNWVKVGDTIPYNFITIENPEQLPVDGPAAFTDLYVFKDVEGSIYLCKWQNKAWVITKQDGPKLSDQIVITASLNDQPVKVMGVVQTQQDLDLNYQGDVADAYIVDDVNKLYSWTGTEWVDTPVH